MARKKKETKAKEPIRIRFKKLANGNQSIYLDTYKGKDKDGKIIREYEYLKLYIVPEVDAASKVQNENTMKAATAIKSQRIIDFTNGKANITSSSRSKMLLADWMQTYIDKKLAGKSFTAREHAGLAAKQLIAYSEKAQLKDVDKDFCNGFVSFLKNRESQKRNGQTITGATAYAYYKRLIGALDYAVEEGIITTNPCRQIKGAMKSLCIEEAKVAYLEEEEIRLLAEARCPNNEVKMAYLFGCFCGLRVSDVAALTWGNIVKNGDSYKLKGKMKKTKTGYDIPLIPEAKAWLPERGDKSDSDKVFSLPCLTCIERNLKKWARNAGITKKVTFHTSRHSFATMMLSAGVSIEVTSELLGHKNIATTQIYAKIVSKKKDEAMNKLQAMFNK